MASIKDDYGPWWSSFIIIPIALWLIFVGIRFVYRIHPVAGIACVVCGVILIIFYFWIIGNKKLKKK